MSMLHPWTRRKFLAASAGTCAWALAGPAFGKDGAPAPLPTATLNRTGRRVPRLGLGCFPIGQLASEEAAAAVLDAAIGSGVRYLDTAPSYARGRSERRVGSAVGRWLDAHPETSREEFYINTKTLERTADGARRELEQSLERLGLDCVDCIQCHEVHDDWPKLFDDDGAIAGLEKAREEGLTKHIGITCHRNPDFIKSAIERYPFVTALVPINPIDVQHRSFVRAFLDFAVAHDVAVIGMKVFGGGFLLDRTDEKGRPLYTPGELLRYALAQPGVKVCVPGCERVEHVRVDVQAVRAFTQPDAAWLAAMEARAGPHEGKSTEWYKDD